MEITASTVKDLREKTSAGMMECKKALTECQGDFEKAVLWLRERGMAQVAKRSGRTANQGLVVCQLKGKRAGLIEINCETDFVAKTDDFQGLATDLMAQLIEKSTAGSNKDDLLAQPFSKNPSLTVSAHVTAVTAKLGENVVIKRLELMELTGPGLFGVYNHGGKVGVLVELGLSDAAAQKEDALVIAKELAMQVAASNPKYLKSENVPADEVAKEREIYLNEAKQSGKPEAVQQKIAEGKMNSYYKQICLMDQPYIREPKKAVKDFVAEGTSKLGENVVVKRYARMQLGE